MIYRSAFIFPILACMLTLPALLTQVRIYINNIKDILNKDLRSVNTWLSSNKFTLNLTKDRILSNNFKAKVDLLVRQPVSYHKQFSH